MSSDPKPENLRNDIIYIKYLGQGAFGKLFETKTPALVPEEGFMVLAVKGKFL